MQEFQILGWRLGILPRVRVSLHKVHLLYKVQDDFFLEQIGCTLYEGFTVYVNYQGTMIFISSNVYNMYVIKSKLNLLGKWLHLSLIH